MPRECIDKSFKGQPGPCPRCGGPLAQSYQTYLIATRRGQKITDPLMHGGKLGWFCDGCPTVVINPADVREVIGASLPGRDVGDEFSVLGIVDLAAIPDEKHHLRLGEEDNPIPLVEFTGTGKKRAAGQRAQPLPKGPPARPARAAKPAPTGSAPSAPPRKLARKKKRRR